MGASGIVRFAVPAGADGIMTIGLRAWRASQKIVGIKASNNKGSSQAPVGRAGGAVCTNTREGAASRS